MDSYVPTSVGMYHHDGSPTGLKIAEFNLMPDGTASLTVFSPEWAREGLGIYEHGMAKAYGGTSFAIGSDGPAFMRSLLDWRSGGTYTAFRDESPQRPNAPGS